MAIDTAYSSMVTLQHEVHLCEMHLCCLVGASTGTTPASNASVSSNNNSTTMASLCPITSSTEMSLDNMLLLLSVGLKHSPPRHDCYTFLYSSPLKLPQL